jgi:hypothetical protein
MSDRPGPSTIASILDTTSWDYSPGADGRVLLATVGRLFATVSWEFKPQHLGISPKRRQAAVRRHRAVNPHETRPNPVVTDGSDNGSR